jgi:hypothetical protein
MRVHEPLQGSKLARPIEWRYIQNPQVGVDPIGCDAHDVLECESEAQAE